MLCRFFCKGRTDEPIFCRTITRYYCAVSWVLIIASVLDAACVRADEEESEGNSAKNDGEAAKLQEFFQELFLGQMIYPQDNGEIQFSTGFFQATEEKRESRLPVLLEYGITDYFQIAAAVPVDFKRHEEAANGVGNIEFEVYWNYYNNPSNGWASGAGFGLGFPSASPDVGDRAFLYEPFVVVARQIDRAGINVSAGLEVKDFLEGEKETEVKGDIAAAIYRKFDHFVSLLELGMEVEREKTTVRLAPGLYWRPAWTKAEIGVSFPIGLTTDTPDFGAWLLITREFQPRKHNNKQDHD
jgi:hypothetical protein